MQQTQLFVPGRVCLFGEHSDWAGAYRVQNPSLGIGRAILTGTDQGLYADIEKHPDRLIFHSRMGAKADPLSIEWPLEPERLLAIAEAGGLFSYVAGTAYQVLSRFKTGGLVINNVKTDLPVKKGLSSSAAVSVLVARSFNQLYDLGLSVREEMELAYQGEITTPSRCGRLDQGCAFGGKPILMTFDGDDLGVDPLPVGDDLHLIIADLAAAKDTKLILSSLNACYPRAASWLAQKAQDYLGEINAQIVKEAAAALAAGDAGWVGRLMTSAQAAFDEHLAPVCPSQLKAPVLHNVLNYKPLQSLILGGKGVGSQGDGAAQFITADAGKRAAAMELIKRELGMDCLELTIRN
ncbi:MAG: GHMP kinase [Candidatus Eisenbacteria bacterium]|uniref:GHMP kinase n=1 Tax=Eiseniibacteriota bacterium TaxID=2212470 RepID=A0A948W2L1_UNCEI|nr:GHMP kinase [Candidatus Eisenbacteria bacterium]MBU2690082.1 GHMP kinase [Candidatus Eisenbacteria bacterium]